ncbi:hypothetical protein GRF29_28g191473 [Pseudopithomyces chartarum]|uniref:Uncharacterized protein n=1 Tax=Pseudopithomyces chartarum TaxID=1892770 RepID=A0AAN6RJ16_9PLEO|nr:hypothetical protein GRF29_28g191473 [Pseudopithomyces chartarum]
MMVPRSYSILQSTSSQPQRSNEKMGVRSPRSPPTLSKSMRVRNIEIRPDPAPQQVTSTPLMHSQPVVIPPRTPSRNTTQTQTVKVRGTNGGRPQHSSRTHKSDAIPPAVAALLAVTAIPKMPSRRRKGSAMDRRISMDELIQEWKQDDSELPASVIGSPLDLLLGRVDESEEEYGSLVSEEQEKDCAQSITTRSISSDSLSTIPPSLDMNAPSFTSTWDELSTPDSYRRSLSDRRERIVSSPPKEDCILDHPLLQFHPDDCEDLETIEIPDVVTPPTVSSERFRSFKSNLTASFQALKSAAKSFSNFTAPSVPPDDLLTRSLLSPKFTSEMRPKHITGTPSAELRRYLNPQPAPISPTELSMQLQDALSMSIDEDTSAPMIQMQTYERRNRSRSRRKSSDPFSEAGRAQSDPPAVRQREPRENSDFLRVIVLEMNMRRVGKLDSKAIGKARIWLPPRKLGASKAPSVQGDENRVPDRWTAILADDV